MANLSDVLLSKLESVSWMYSINCQIHGKENTLLIKFIVEDDYYAVMVTDLTQTYFECLEGKDIDDHYRRFNRSEVKRERLLTHMKTLLADVTKADEWHFELLLVDCHTSRLTLKVKNTLSIVKFEWSFYMISTNPETLSRHLTLPLLRLVSSMKYGIDCLRTNEESCSTEEKLISQMLNYQTQLTIGTDDNSLINDLVNDQTIASLLSNSNKFTDNSNNSDKNAKPLDQTPNNSSQV